MVAKLAVILALCVYAVHGQSSDDRDKIWTIASGHDWGAHEYIDDAGYLQGFLYDLIGAVCQTAQIKCRTIWDKYTNCWDSEAGQHSTGGKGLMAGYYDACSGWTATVDRTQVFSFSMPFFPASKIFFYKKKNSAFDDSDITGKTIGFQDGFMSDEKCLARQNVKGVPLPAGNVKHYEDSKLMVDDLAAGKIDAVFVIDDHLTDDDRIEKMTTSFMCSSTGDGIMTRKDNGFSAHWNRGFQQLQASGQFKKLCDEGRKKHAAVGTFQPCL